MWRPCAHLSGSRSEPEQASVRHHVPHRRRPFRRATQRRNQRRGRSGDRRHHRRGAPRRCAADDGKNRTARLAFLADVLNVIPVLDYDREAAEAHAELLVHVRRQGRRRGAHDLLIAATAKATRRIVVPLTKQRSPTYPKFTFGRTATTASLTTRDPESAASPRVVDCDQALLVPLTQNPAEVAPSGSNATGDHQGSIAGIDKSDLPAFGDPPPATQLRRQAGLPPVRNLGLLVRSRRPLQLLPSYKTSRRPVAPASVSGVP